MSNTVHREPSAQSRRGLTLIELIMAFAITSLLGMITVSAITIVTRSVDSHLRAADGRTDEAARITDRLTEELRTAIRVDQPVASDGIAFTVPDQDGDGQPDRMRYFWSGPPDHTLTRIAYLSQDDPSGTPVVIATDVRVFDLEYVTRTWGEQPPFVPLESDEVLLIAHDDRPADHGTDVLFVVTNAGGPTAGELTRQGLMQSWGFTIAVIEDEASPAAFQDAIDAADVVYVSTAADADAIGTKLNDVAIGVISEHPALMDDLGIAAAYVSAGHESVVQVNEMTHHLTSAFLPGPVPLFEASQPVVTMSTAPDAMAPGLAVLGSWNADPSFGFVEVGAELVGAGSPGTFGETTAHPTRTEYSEYKDDCVATLATLAVDVSVTSIMAYLDVKKDGKELRVAIYADDDGEPGARLGESDTVEFDTGVGWRSIDLQTPLVLTAGTYWLTMTSEADVAYFFDVTGGQSRYANPPGNPRDNGFPAEWSDTYGPDPNPARYSIYASYTGARLAQGRRVALPWGAAGFDASALADDGKVIMQRALEWAADPSPGDQSEPFFVLKNQWPSQYILPELPVNATGWSITRVYVAIRADEREPDGTVTFEIRHSVPGFIPAEEIIATTAAIAVSQFSEDAYQWYQVPLPVVDDLNPDNGVCLVLRGSKDENAIVKLDRLAPGTSGTHFISTPDQGGTWTLPNQLDDMRVYVCGTYTTNGEPVWP